MLRDKVRLALVAAFCLVATTFALVPASAAPPPKGTEWTQHYFPSEDGLTMLHADVLRPEGLTNKDKTPVILTVSPYTNHSGSTTDFDPGAEGPNERFYDFLEISDIIERGYTYVMVDLPGFGGSGGCNDWGGLREQEASKAAVEWAASQPWSTGKVGMMGKSYDGWTGLMAMAQKPKGLAAVVSMEPVYSGYRYLFNNGVRFSNSLATPAGFQVYDAKPGTINDDPMYHANGAPQVWCYGVNYGMQQLDEEDSDFWAERNLLRFTKGDKTPLFLTQGFLETNTKSDAAFDFFNRLGGSKNRAWFGQFDHYRGWELDEKGKFHVGRSTFANEMMRFLDRHVKGVSGRQTRMRSSSVSVQDNLGRYRVERAWPPRDSRLLWTKLRPGTYADNGRNNASGSSAGQGIWTFSQELKHDAWLAGEPQVKLSIDAVPRANVVANLYDVSPKGTATLVSRGTKLVRGVGAQDISFELYGQDWLVKKGHRLAVIISGANADWWVHIPTNTDVTVTKARIGLPFLRYRRDSFVDGKSTPTLKSYLGSRTTDVEPQEIKSADKKFRLPGRLAKR
jgi:predicted acyl esterase